MERLGVRSEEQVVRSAGAKYPLREAVQFAGLMWGTSRLFVLLAIGIVSLLDEDVPDGWAVFAQWDGEHYIGIAETGYRFQNDGQGYNVAFFPLFPLLIRAGMAIGLSPEAAGTLINNLAFFGALVVLYLWMLERHDRTLAKWSVAALAWNPFSLFGSMVYTEGLFLLSSTAALRAFDKRQYGWASLWGIITTAIRPPGIALVPTFLLAAWREKRGMAAYLTAIGTTLGLLLYMLYCWHQFDEPLAFFWAQQGWRPSQKYFGAAWVSLFLQAVVGYANEDKRRLVDPWYPLAIGLIIGLGFLLWSLRHRLGFPKTGYGFCLLVILLWLVAGTPLVNIVTVFGGAYLIWHLRHKLNRLAFYYGIFSWFIILGNGRTISAERFAFGCVTLAIALGILFSKAPRWGYATLIFFAILLGSLSVRFAQGLWAG
jgi:Gpi18-like mannosyltransferase